MSASETPEEALLFGGVGDYMITPFRSGVDTVIFEDVGNCALYRSSCLIRELDVLFDERRGHGSKQCTIG